MSAAPKQPSTGARQTGRPVPGAPRPYRFPDFIRDRLPNGLTLLATQIPGRPLVSATLLLPIGAVDEPAELGGATILAAHALTEGTELRDGVALTEAAERLGASLHSDAGWDSFSVGVDVPAERLAPALELLAEVLLRPTFPKAEVERLREERLNDILQARADPRRRADEAFVDAVYSAETPYHRPAAGLEATVAGLDRDRLLATYRRALDPARLTLVIGGDLSGLDVAGIAGRLLGGWAAAPEASAPGPAVVRRGSEGRLIRVIDRPGSVQTEIRVGHVGLPRRIPDFHPLVVMSAILGGMFASRLNMKLREEKGYTYGAHAGFDLRRFQGPFVARAAVNSEVTAPALVDMLAELRQIREAPVTADELRSARDYLVGVFPLRFETPGPVVGAIAGMVVHGLPDDELARYRPAIEAVTIDAVGEAARAHVDPDRAAIVLVGDAERIVPELEREVGSVEVVRSPDGGAGA